MQTRLFDADPVTGIRRLFHWDPVDRKAHIETIHDVEDILEGNKERYNGVDERAGWKGEMHRVASIPMPLFFELKKKGIVDDPKALRQWLNDSDNRLFRTRPGRV